ncbi:MAG TPA: hypothetical protein VGL81_29480 [Polyangiaceae bacterium]|jgi:hypothetical protein
MPRRNPPPPTKEPTRDELVRAQSVVLEDIRSQLALVLEGSATARNETRSDIRDLKAELSERISLLEGAVRQNSADIKQNSADIIDLRQQVAGLRDDFDHRHELGRLPAH